MKKAQRVWPLLSVLAISCADSGGPVTVDARWNLTCPSQSQAGCGSAAPNTCLNDGVGANERAIVGQHGDITCTDDPIIATCEGIERSGGTSYRLEADVGGAFGFELEATIGSDNAPVEPFPCNVTIVEDGLSYDIGACGTEPPSPEQPCQLSSITVGGGEVTFDLQCDSLLSSTTGFGFDVGATGGGPTTIRFANCTGL
ncbi:MAG: hypothetical protein AMS21_00420 [Gemmatimonas sp. SG8_38_2]|nr:MAG: hypothetical protein AMS21_00420 [Gemmatimonas sp. SG8_38_2]